MVSTTPPFSKMRRCDFRRASSGSVPSPPCADAVSGGAALPGSPAPAFRTARRDPLMSMCFALIAIFPSCLLRPQHVARPLCQRGGCSHNPCNQQLDIFTTDRVDLHAELFGVREKCVVSHCRIERTAQGCKAFRRHKGWCEERPRHPELGEYDFHDLAVLRCLGEL